MAIKSDNIDFKEYINNLIDEMYEDKKIYTGKIREERLNGKIQNFIINLKIEEEENA